MAAIAALLDTRASLGVLRRSLPRGAGPVVAHRSASGLERGLVARMVEAMVVGVRAARDLDLPGLRSRFPTIPLLIYGAIRPEDGALVLGYHRLGVSALLVEGVDEAVAGDIVHRCGASASRRTALAEAPRRLRLTEPLQVRAWDRLVSSVGRPPRTSALAAQLGLSREHLSRQFSAGGAPNLKRVSDLIAVLTALDLLENPGYQPVTVARLLGFSSPSHLRATVRRLMGTSLEACRQLAMPELVRRFASHSAGSRNA
jgi:AraC-like DNA-binding protein